MLNELLQNAFDHAYPEGKDYDAGQVTLRLEQWGDELVMRVIDDGAGLPDGFQIEHSPGLGLSIVRTLVTSELGGSIAMRTGTGPPERPGAEVELRIPVLATASEE